ncbi:MAG TPA: hypothetical protein VNP90_10390, partial [Actinomycetota bacterium]|nr:hypothetical protein [Actinomycetota bacterium]
MQVVLGEAERTDGLLRFILEGEGFDIIGLASDDHELARVLRGARPEVIVLDGGISATAALEAREHTEGASLVVVWPDGVAAVIAAERVDPSSSISDLGDAVRRAAELAHVADPTIRVPDVQTTRMDEESRAEIRYPNVRRDPPSPARSRGRRGQLLVAATTWMLALTTLATIAIAVPNALDPSSRHDRRPSHSVSVNRPDERTATPQRSGADTGRPAPCDGPATAQDRSSRSRGATSTEPVRAEGCPPDRAQGDAGKGEGGDRPDDPGGKGEGGGRPDDPGGQADGRGSRGQAPGDARGGTGGSQETDGEGPEHGNAGNAGN